MGITVIVITKNNEDKIGRCLESVKALVESLEGEILVVDGGSTDKTVSIAKKHGARVIEQRGDGYSAWRNQGLEEAKGEWVFYLDSDEVATAELAGEISHVVSQESKMRNQGAYAIPRRNIIFGKEMRHGGWWPDYVKRLFKRDLLKRWEGDLHEEPVFQGELGHLQDPMIHYKHHYISEMIDKTNKWSEVEAKLLFDAGHPKMAWWRFFRIVRVELLYRYVWKLGFLDGTAGAVYALYQSFSKFVTYVKLWEMQSNSSKD